MWAYKGKQKMSNLLTIETTEDEDVILINGVKYKKVVES